MDRYFQFKHYLARSGLLYRWAKEGKEDENAKTGYELFDISIPNLDSIAGRKQLITNLQYWTRSLLQIGMLCLELELFLVQYGLLGRFKRMDKGFGFANAILHTFAYGTIEQIDDTR